MIHSVHFMEAVMPTFAESCPLFSFFNFCQRILLSVLADNLLGSQRFVIKVLIFQYGLFHCIIIIMHKVIPCSKQGFIYSPKDRNATQNLQEQEQVVTVMVAPGHIALHPQMPLLWGIHDSIKYMVTCDH